MTGRSQPLLNLNREDKPQNHAVARNEDPEEINKEELCKLVKARLYASAQSRRAAKKEKKAVKVKVGDLVLIRTHPISEFWANVTKKLFLLYKGPYIVQEIKCETCYVLKEIDSDETIGRALAGLTPKLRD